MSTQPRALFCTRQLVADDIGSVLRIEQASYDFPWSENIFRSCLQAGYRCFAAADDSDSVSGYALLSVAVDEAHVLNLCVDPACRRQGVAQLLLERMLLEARQAELRAILLEVRPSNTGARALYATYGFKHIGTRTDYYPAHNGREDAYLLSRRVNRPGKR